MKLHFTRTGGLAGTKLEARLDTAELPAAEGQSFERLAAEAPLLENRRAAPRSADRFVYRLAIEQDARESVAQFDDESLPERLRAVVDRLVEVARRSRTTRTRPS